MDRTDPFSPFFLADGPSASQMYGAGMAWGESPAAWALAHPAFLREQARRFAAAGVHGLLLPTLRANAPALASWDLSPRADELNEGLARLGAEAAGPLPVGGRLGPTGLAFDPENPESFDAIYHAYRAQVRALQRGGASFLLAERLASLADMRAAVLAARRSGLPVCVTVTPPASPGGGPSFLTSLIVLQAMGAPAVGVDGVPFETAEELLRESFPHAQTRLAARLPVTPALTPAAFARQEGALAALGAAVLGAGSGARPEYDEAAAAFVTKAAPTPGPEADCRAAASAFEVFFLGDDIELSEPLPCTMHLADDLIEAERSGVTAALVCVETMDDAMLLAGLGALARMPVAVYAESVPVLEAALRYFQGRLLVDTSSPLEEEAVSPVAAKYGALLY